MGKELPFFKFFPFEWLSGNISLESYETQGLFISICSYYWQRDCNLTQTNLHKKFNDNNIEIKKLIDLGTIQIKRDQVFIKFLSEQYMELREKRKKLSDAGIKGNRLRWKLKNNSIESGDNRLMIATRSQPDRNIDIEKDKDLNYTIHQLFIDGIFKEKETIYAIWLDSIYMSFGIKKGTVGKLLKSFSLHLKMQSVVHKDIESFKHHFINWLRKQEDSSRLNEYKIKKVGAL